jgi:hypothetical protein
MVCALLAYFVQMFFHKVYDNECLRLCIQHSVIEDESNSDHRRPSGEHPKVLIEVEQVCPNYQKENIEWSKELPDRFFQWHVSPESKSHLIIKIFLWKKFHHISHHPQPQTNLLFIRKDGGYEKE